jgi:hypothetical protein
MNPGYKASAIDAAPTPAFGENGDNHVRFALIENEELNRQAPLRAFSSQPPETTRKKFSPTLPIISALRA